MVRDSEGHLIYGQNGKKYQTIEAPGCLNPEETGLLDAPDSC